MAAAVPHASHAALQLTWHNGRVPTSPRLPAALGRVALVSATCMALAACSPSSPEPEVGRSGVELWPQYQDFVLDPNKAMQPADAFRALEKWESHDYLQRIAGTPQARWVGDFTWNDSNTDRVRTVLRAARDQQRIGLLAVAGDPFADCDVEETAESAAAALVEYGQFLAAVVKPVEELEPASWVVLEPGTLASLDQCGFAEERLQVVERGVTTLAEAGFPVFVDIGGVGQLDPEQAAERLASLPVQLMEGFALNIGGFRSDEDQAAYGDEVVALLAERGVTGLGYVIDSSRNGLPLDGEDLCNPPGIAIGKAPRVVEEGNLRAYLWIKRPGESDGFCNGGVDSGQFWLEQAMELARNGDPGLA